MTTHYLLDVSWLLYRGYFAFSKIYSEFPELHFLVKKLESILSSNKENIIHMCCDGYNPKGRRLLGSEYKANRHQEGSYDVYTGLSSFINLLRNDRVKIYYNKDYESDELIFTLSRLLEGRKKILSGDKDLLQALKSDTVIDSGKSFLITEASYKIDYADQFLEVDPIRLPIFRAIRGDVSDTLKPPVARFPKKVAAKIASSIDYDGDTPSVDELLSLSNLSANEKKWLDRLVDSYELFKINFDIMKLNVISSSINEKYERSECELSDFLKTKIQRINSL